MLLVRCKPEETPERFLLRTPGAMVSRSSSISPEALAKHYNWNSCGMLFATDLLRQLDAWVPAPVSDSGKLGRI
jgi:hypothetical protein